jgi:uncharacterized RDD family membrane protein YckC
MYCSKCGAAVAEGTAFCSACGQPTGAAAVTQPQTQPGAMPPAPMQPQAAVPPAPPHAQPVAATGVLYAGFWLRVVAAIIDNLILGVPTIFLVLLIFAGAMPMFMRGAQENPMAVAMVFLPRVAALAVISVVGRWLYWSLMEASEWQATLGKKALGLYVTDLEGRRATFSRTSGRFWAGRGISIVPYLGFLYYLIDCIMAGLTERKQALHDSIANCLVLRKA